MTGNSGLVNNSDDVVKLALSDEVLERVKNSPICLSDEQISKSHTVGEENDMVNKPPHYCREGGMECIEEMIMLFGAEEVATFCKLTAYRYRYRVLDKWNPHEDMAKSDWYINKYKELTQSTNSELIAEINALKKHITRLEDELISIADERDDLKTYINEMK